MKDWWDDHFDQRWIAFFMGMGVGIFICAVLGTFLA